MRKLSMKKLGTPIGAGPGSEKEKVGLVGVGTPVVVRSGVAGFFVAVAQQAHGIIREFLAIRHPAQLLRQFPGQLLDPLTFGLRTSGGFIRIRHRADLTIFTGR